jgi:hypothetical protein
VRLLVTGSPLDFWEREANDVAHVMCRAPGGTVPEFNSGGIATLLYEAPSPTGAAEHVAHLVSKVDWPTAC